MSPDYHLAQINVARARAPLDSPRLKDFVDQLDAINALAERSPGFVWRLKSDSGNAMDVRVYDDPLMIVNMSVWTGLEALRDYAYKSDHVAVFRRRKEWFEELPGPALAMWWIPAGTIPDPHDARRRLEFLERNGPSATAFNFRNQLPPPNTET
jgi:hypothetical protein